MPANFARVILRPIESVSQMRLKAQRHAGTPALLRALHPRVAAQFDRRAYLLVRMHVLCVVRRAGPLERLPQLRRRFHSAARTARAKLERRKLSRQGPAEHDGEA